MEKISTTLVTGFLGSGKTTIILHLIEQLQGKGHTVVYVKNEIGSDTTDTEIIKRTHIQTKELLNGCICCTLTGPFIQAIDELVSVVHPDWIIIEASGSADPAALSLMISSHRLLRRDSVISVIDVTQFNSFEDVSYSAREQAKFTDFLVFNKVELVNLARKQQVVEYVREVNEYAPIIEAPHGIVSIDVVCGINSREWLEHTHIHDHVNKDELDSVTIYVSTSVDAKSFSEKLKKLPPNVFRVKGFIQDKAMHWYILNKVGDRITLEDLSVSDTQIKSFLICIGFHIDKKELEFLNEG